MAEMYSRELLPTAHTCIFILIKMEPNAPALLAICSLATGKFMLYFQVSSFCLYLLCDGLQFKAALHHETKD